jgi:hypothetical protein
MKKAGQARASALSIRTSVKERAVPKRPARFAPVKRKGRQKWPSEIPASRVGVAH